MTGVLRDPDRVYDDYCGGQKGTHLTKTKAQRKPKNRIKNNLKGLEKQVRDNINISG